MKNQEIINILNLVLDDFLETHRDVSDIEPTNKRIVEAFEIVIDKLTE